MAWEILGEDLEEAAAGALAAAGAPEEAARLVARHLVDNEVIGHPSHGVIRLREYWDAIRRGELIPAARPRITHETAASAQVDGGWTFGQVVAEFAAGLAVRKARITGVSAVAVRRVKHIGRLGRYAELAAEAGAAAVIFTSGGGRGVNQAPFGGLDRKLSSNPFAMSFPSGLEGPFVLDMATSAAAEGKIRMHRAEGLETPPGWIIDRDGNPTTDPNDYYEGGALLPLGGAEGHKGYALAFMIDLFSGVLSGGGSPGDPARSLSNNTTIIVLDPSRFAPLEALKERAARMTAHIKDTRLRDAGRPVKYPGEIEAAARAADRNRPIRLPDATRAGFLSVLRELSLPDPAPLMKSGVSQPVKSGVSQPVLPLH